MGNRKQIRQLKMGSKSLKKKNVNELEQPPPPAKRSDEYKVEKTAEPADVYEKKSSSGPKPKFDKKKKDMQRRKTPMVMGGDGLDEKANEASWDDRNIQT